jgi:hypothetical protein
MPYPTVKEHVLKQKNAPKGGPLMTDLEHNEFMTKGAGKNLIWNNYY